jgi:hypothetical protein
VGSLLYLVYQTSVAICRVGMKVRLESTTQTFVYIIPNTVIARFGQCCLPYICLPGRYSDFLMFRFLNL